MLEMKFKANVNGVSKEIANHGDSDHATLPETSVTANLVT